MRRCTRHPKVTFSHDLHVLGTPPAFVLSQDQTLQFKPSRVGALARHCPASRTDPMFGTAATRFAEAHQATAEGNTIPRPSHHRVFLRTRKTARYSAFKERTKPPGSLSRAPEANCAQKESARRTQSVRRTHNSTRAGQRGQGKAPAAWRLTPRTCRPDRPGGCGDLRPGAPGQSAGDRPESGRGRPGPGGVRDR